MEYAGTRKDSVASNYYQPSFVRIQKRVQGVSFSRLRDTAHIPKCEPQRKQLPGPGDYSPRLILSNTGNGIYTRTMYPHIVKGHPAFIPLGKHSKTNTRSKSTQPGTR